MKTEIKCEVCGGEVTAAKPEKYPYCRNCHYTGSAAEAMRADQLNRFRAAFPDATVEVEHTGGGCFWLTFKWDGDARYYTATDGEAGLPRNTDPDDDTPLTEGGWGYVGRYANTDDESHPDYEGVTLTAPADSHEDYWTAYPKWSLSDAQVIGIIQADRRDRGLV